MLVTGSSGYLIDLFRSINLFEIKMLLARHKIQTSDMTHEQLLFTRIALQHFALKKFSS